MARKKLEEITNSQKAGYLSWGDDAGKSEAFNAFAKTTQEKTLAYNRDFSNLLPGISGKPGLTREDYEYYRPDSIIPKKPKDILIKCERAYQQCGRIRDIIDTMGDFSSQGIRISHPNTNKERMIRDWFTNKIDGQRITERFCNHMARHGIVYVYSYTGKLKNEEFFKLVAMDELRVLPEPIKTKKKEIPYKYLFLNPTLIEPMEGALAVFADKPTYGVRLPKDLAAIIKNPKTEEQKAQVAKLPPSIVEAATSNRLIPIEADKLFVWEYRKDDWLPQAMPLIFSCLDDIKMLNQLKLADMCALDSLAGKKRIWRLGNLEHKIMPNPEVFATFANMLEANTSARYDRNSMGAGR